MVGVVLEDDKRSRLVESANNFGVPMHHVNNPQHSLLPVLPRSLRTLALPEDVFKDSLLTLNASNVCWRPSSLPSRLIRYYVTVIAGQVIPLPYQLLRSIVVPLAHALGKLSICEN